MTDRAGENKYLNDKNRTFWVDWFSLYEFIYLLACNNMKSSMQSNKGQKYDLYVWEKSKTKIRKYRSTKGEKYKSIGQTVRLHQQERWSCACSCSPWLPWPTQRSPSSSSILKLTFPCSTVFNIIVIKIACCHVLLRIIISFARLACPSWTLVSCSDHCPSWMTRKSLGLSR